MAVDIREVALRSGVSAATVSRALNGRPDVSPATRARVVAVARELGYLPNSQARALVRRRSDIVGLIWDTAYLSTKGRHPFLQDVLVGLKTALAETGYSLLLLSPRGGDVDAFSRTAAQHGLDGVVLMSVDDHLPAVEALVATGRPCVGLDLPLTGGRASHVTTDNVRGGALVAEHLLSLGHRRIATITGPLRLLPAQERYDGFCGALAAAGVPLARELVVGGDFFLGSGEVAMRQLLALAEPPTAVFAAGDEMALGAVRTLAAAGLRVPDDVSVVGFDDLEVAALVPPGLTTVAQDPFAMGRAAVELLVELMDDAAPPPAPRRLSAHLVVRGSTARWT